MTQSAAEIKSLIAAARQVWMDAWRGSDTKTMETILCDDVVFMPPNETSLYGKDEVMEWLSEYSEHFRVTVVNGTETELVLAGDLAIEQWSYMVAIELIHGNERIRDDGRFFTIWKQEPKGVWKISQTMWNSIRPIGTGTSRYLARLREKS